MNIWKRMWAKQAQQNWRDRSVRGRGNRAARLLIPAPAPGPARDGGPRSRCGITRAEKEESMTKREWNERADLHSRLHALGIGVEDAERLRRCARTLHRWAEMECGDEHGNAVERDETTGKPFVTWEMPDGRRSKPAPTPDREAGALRRIRGILEPLGLAWFHQTDPRGASLYVSREALTAENYNRGIAVW